MLNESNVFHLFHFFMCGGALVFLRGAGAPARPSLAPHVYYYYKKNILHLFLGVPAATVGGTCTPVAMPLVGRERGCLFHIS